MTWKTTLRDIIGGYFSDWSIEDGVTQMVFVGVNNAEYHHSYLSAINAGIKATIQGDNEVFEIIKEECYVKDIVDAQKLLQNILNEYMFQYEAAINNDSSASTA